MITIYIPALYEYEFLYSKREYTTYWGIFSLLISMIGLLIRIFVAGYTPQNTSGKNTKEQVLEQVQKLASNIMWPKRTLKSGPRKGIEIFDDCCYDMADAFVIGRANFIEKKVIHLT